MLALVLQRPTHTELTGIAKNTSHKAPVSEGAQEDLSQKLEPHMWAKRVPAAGALPHIGGFPGRATHQAAVLSSSLGPYLTNILVPIPKAQKQMGQHMNHVGLEELPQHGTEHLKGKQGSWGKKVGELRKKHPMGKRGWRLPVTSSPSLRVARKLKCNTFGLSTQSGIWQSRKKEGSVST
jgi:hypothetical protein